MRIFQTRRYSLWNMHIITLAGILLSSSFWRNVAGEETVPTSPTYTLKAVDATKCDVLSTDCIKDFTVDKLSGCRVNAAKRGCTFDLTMVNKLENLKLSVMKEDKNAAVIKTDVATLNGWSLTSVQITNIDKKQLKDAKLVFKTGEMKDLKTEDVIEWTSLDECTITDDDDTFKCGEGTHHHKLPKGPFSLAVIKADKSTPQELTALFGATITLTRKGIHAIPKLSEKEAHYKLKWNPACDVKPNDVCYGDLKRVQGVKDCLKLHQKDGCTVTPTISFGDDSSIGLIETDLTDVNNLLPIVFINLEGLDTTITDHSKLTVTKLDFSVTPPTIGTDTELIVSGKLASHNTAVHNTKVTAKGEVSGDYLTKSAPHDFSKGQFVYLNKGLADGSAGTFKPTIELQGEMSVNGRPAYTLAIPDANVENCSPIPAECGNGAGGQVNNIEKCIAKGNANHCKMTFGWTYTQTEAAILPDAKEGKFPIVYLGKPVATLPADQEFTITEIRIIVDNTSIKSGCYSSKSKVFAGPELSKLTEQVDDRSSLTVSGIHWLSYNSSATAANFRTKIAATSGNYYQIQPVPDKSNCDITGAVKMVFSVTSVIDPTVTKVHPNSDLDKHAEWQKGVITAEITDSGTQCKSIQECNALTDVTAMGKCIAALKKKDDCKDKPLSFTTVLTQPNSSLIKIDHKDVAAFEIKSIKDSDIHLGLGKTDGKTAAPIRITHIEGTVSTPGDYKLYRLTYDSAMHTFAKIGIEIWEDTVTAEDNNLLSVPCDITLTEDRALFGLFTRSQDDAVNVESATRLALTNIKITASVEGTAQDLEVAPKFEYVLETSNAVPDNKANDPKICSHILKDCIEMENQLTNFGTCVKGVNSGKCKVDFSLTYKQTTPTPLKQVDTHKSPIIYFEPEKTVTTIDANNAGFEITKIAMKSTDAKLTDDCYKTGIKIFHGTDPATAFTEATEPSVTFDMAAQKFIITNLTATPKTYYQIRPTKATANCDITSPVTMSFTVNKSIDKRAAEITYSVTAVEPNNCATIDQTKCGVINSISQLNQCRFNTNNKCLLNVNMIHKQTPIPPTQVKGESKAIVIPLKVETLGGFKLETVEIDGVSIPLGALLFISEEVVTSQTDVTKLKQADQCTANGQKFTCSGTNLFKTKQNYSLIVVTSANKLVPTANSFKATITLVRNNVHPIPVLGVDQAKYEWTSQSECNSVETCKSYTLLTADQFRECYKSIQKDNCRATPTVILTAPADSGPVETGLEGEEKGLAAVFVDPKVFLLDDFFSLNHIKLDTVDFKVTPAAMKDKAKLLVNDKLTDDGEVVVGSATANTNGLVSGLKENDKFDFTDGKFMYLSNGIKENGKFKPQMTLMGNKLIVDGQTDEDLTKELKAKSTWSIEEYSLDVTPASGTSCDVTKIDHCQSLTTNKISKCIETLNTSCKGGTIIVQAVLTGTSIPHKVAAVEAAAFQINKVTNSDLHLGLTRQDKTPVHVNIVQIEGEVEAGEYELSKLGLQRGKYTRDGDNLATVTVGADGKFSTDVKHTVLLEEEGVVFGLFKSVSAGMKSRNRRRRRLQAPEGLLQFKNIKVTAHSESISLSDLTTNSRPNHEDHHSNTGGGNTGGANTGGAPSMFIRGSLMISCCAAVLLSL